MKYFFYLPLFVLFFSCQNESADTTTPSDEPNKLAETATVSNEQEANKSFEFKPQGAPGLSDPQKALVNGIWAIEGYVEVSNKDAQKQNVGRWYNFKEDGTYERGRYNKTRGNGKWTFDEETKLLTMEDKEGAFNSQFKVRMTPTGQTMIVVGTNRYNQTRIQGKFVVMSDYPKQ